MNWMTFLSRAGRSGPRARSPFAAGEPAAPALATPAELQLSPGAAGVSAVARPRAAARPRPSWFGWLLGRNRRREAGPGFVQGELLLQNVRPLRNDFREEAAAPPAERLRGRVLYETPTTPERRDDQDHAWNRLRNRRPDSLVMKGD